jgi:ATP-binding cassette subfamily C (CFTR/MRP) protein 1
VSTSFSLHVQDLRIVLIYSAKMFTLLLRNRQAQTKLIDKRVGLMAEILNNLRAVKLYAYEKSMSQKVSAVREEEMAILRTYGGLRSTLNSLFGFIPVLAAVCRSCITSICHC